MSYENVPKNLTEQAVLTRDGRPDYLKLAADPFPSPTVDEVGAILENTDTGDRYRWTSTQWIKTHIASILIPRDYRTDVARGLIPGESLTAIVARNPAVGTGAYEDVWGAGGVMVYPTAAESWEIVSSSASDTSAGTGARTVFITSLDANLEVQTQTVTLSGVTPAALTGTHLRPQSVIVLTAGSNEVNVGTLTLRVASAGATRNVVLPDIGQSMDAHYTIPANKTGLILTTSILFSKNDTGTFRNRFRDATTPNASWVVGSVFSGHENKVDFEFASLPFATSGLDIQLQMISASGSIDSSVLFEISLKDN